MIITQNQFYREFERICKMSLTHSTCRLAIFVSCFDIDAICSSKMLSEYLKKQFIVFQLIPVVGYIDMKEKFLKLDFDIMNVVLIGCGATADLESFLEIDLNNYLTEDMDGEEAQRLISMGKLGEVKLTRKIYVIDGHRPWNLDNLYGSPMVYCLDDNSTAELTSEKEAFYYLINSPDGESENDVENEESEEDIEDLAADGDEDNDNEELDLEDSLDRKRNRSEQVESSKKRRKRLTDEYHDALESYYQQGSTISIPSSHQVYDLLSTIGEISIDFLWLAIIGSRSLRNIYQRVYELVYPGLKNEVQRLQSENDSFSMRNNQDSNGTDGTSSSSLLNFNVSKRADNTGLQSCKEYTLFLLHHWTLYDAFFYSDYVNSKCHLYSNDGRRLLKTMFARMGISLIQANQNWHYLDLDLKKKLDGLILREVGKFNLTEVIIDGFKRNYGFHGSISSGDYVEAVQALLEYAMPQTFHGGNSTNSLSQNGRRRRNEVGDNGDGGDGNDDDVNDDDAEDDNRQGGKHDTRTKNEQFVAGFWRAYDALYNYDSIIRGMEIAKFQQQFIFEKGSEIIQKGMVKTQSKFKVVILNESFTTNSSITRSNFNDSTFNKSASSLKDDRVVDIKTFGNGAMMFQNPLILTKLGNWILNVQADLDEGLLPLLIGAYNSDTGTYLICGLPSRTSFEDDDEEDDSNDESDDVDSDEEIEEGRSRGGGSARGRKASKHGKRKREKNSSRIKQQKVILNAFSVLFEKVTQEISIQARMDSFQSAIIELRKEDLTKFLDGLTRYSQYML